MALFPKNFSLQKQIDDEGADDYVNKYGCYLLPAVKWH
jgi:hypothetical protein